MRPIQERMPQPLTLDCHPWQQNRQVRDSLCISHSRPAKLVRQKVASFQHMPWQQRSRRLFRIPEPPLPTRRAPLQQDQNLSSVSFVYVVLKYRVGSSFQDIKKGVLFVERFRLKHKITMAFIFQLKPP